MYNKTVYQCSVHKIKKKKNAQVKTKFGSSVKMICCSVLIEKIKTTILCLYFFIMIGQGTVDLLEAPFWRCRTENIWFKLPTLRSSVTVRLSIHLIQIAFKKNYKSKILRFHKHFVENKDVTNNDSNLERFCSPRNNWVL